jgi:hypothetical protein
VYQWLSSDALQVDKQLSHAEPPPRAVGSASAFSAVADGLVFRRSDGFHHVSLDGKDRLFCSEAVCQNVNPHPIFSNGPVTAGRVAFLTNYGAGCVELNGRLLWSKAVSKDLQGNQLLFQGITASADGRRIAFDVLRGGRGHEDFDGVHLERTRRFWYTTARRARAF